jgi:hypothetical protein
MSSTASRVRLETGATRAVAVVATAPNEAEEAAAQEGASAEATESLAASAA